MPVHIQSEGSLLIDARHTVLQELARSLLVQRRATNSNSPLVPVHFCASSYKQSINTRGNLCCLRSLINASHHPSEPFHKNVFLYRQISSSSSQSLQKRLKGLKEETGREKRSSPKTRVVYFPLIKIAPFCWVLPLSQVPGWGLICIISFIPHNSGTQNSSPTYRWGYRGSQSLWSFYFQLLRSPHK